MEVFGRFFGAVFGIASRGRRIACAAVLAVGVACGSEADAAVTEIALEVDEEVQEIVGGNSYAALPAVGALFRDGRPSCTGTLIGSRKVLTAAHCVRGIAPSRLRFRIGQNAYDPDHNLGVRSTRAHPDYDPDTLENDIAIVNLKSTAVAPPLDPLDIEMDDGWVGERLLFVGYGVTNGTSQVGAGRKRAVRLPIRGVEETSFWFATPGKNTCNGDSGGPALFEGFDGRWRIAGVTSWGDEGCRYFGVDTRVDPYIDFIESR